MSRLAIRTVGVAACAAAMLGLGATAASAGEITRNGDYTPVNAEFNRGVAASECAYSGLNDDYVNGATGASRVQTYPQERKALAEFGVVLPKGLPGFACNPSGKRGG